MNTNNLRALAAWIHASEACFPYIVTADSPPEPGASVAGKDTAIAAIVNVETETVERSLTVEEVFDTLFETGDYLALKTAELQGNPTAILAFAVLRDAKSLGPGKVNMSKAATVNLFAMLRDAGLISQSGLDALNVGAVITQPKSVALFGAAVTPADVSRALRGPWGDE